MNTTSKNINSFYDFIKAHKDGNNKWDIFLLKPLESKTWGLNNIENLDIDLYLLSNYDNEKFEKNKLCIIKFTKIINAVKKLANLNIASQTSALDNIDNQAQFEKIKSDFLDNFDYYAKSLRACMKVLAMIYYCLLLIVITAAGVSMMFYACLKRQGYLLTFMKILWNIIRFFMFSFFLYGTAYGIGFLAIRDSIAYIMYVFSDNAYGIGFLAIRDSIAYIMYVFSDNLEQSDADVKLVGNGKDFFKFAKDHDNNLKTKYDEIYVSAIDEFFTNYREINISDCDYGNIKKNLKDFYDEIPETGTDLTRVKFKYLYNEAGREGGIFGSFDCSFVKSDLNILYTALYDASVESRALAALSLSASFFGAVAVYFYLLVMHHYNDLFFDSGKSIFRGFDGFGGGYHKKNKNQDPAYKKRKLRAELDLTSKNEELSNYKEYKDVNKNDEED